MSEEALLKFTHPLKEFGLKAFLLIISLEGFISVFGY